MTKTEFLQQFQEEKYNKYDPVVIEFIANILYDDRNRNDALRSFFHSGYCYYFAVMLQNAFQKGFICIAEPLGHIVWVDDKGCAYDIEGPYLPLEHDCIVITPVSFLGRTLCDFLHIPGKEYHAPKDFHDWATFMKFTDIFAITKVYQEIPRNQVDYSIPLEDNAYWYWVNHKQELQKKFWTLRQANKLKELSVYGTSDRKE